MIFAVTGPNGQASTAEYGAGESCNPRPSTGTSSIPDLQTQSVFLFSSAISSALVSSPILSREAGSVFSLVPPHQGEAFNPLVGE